jgi:putative FmdB family regulatory protein
MPTYDYRCRKCDHRWEMFQSIKANAIKKCPACGKQQAQRVIGAGAGILFRGSGFYQTDYRSESYKKAAEADRKVQSGGSGGEGAGKSESNGSAKSAEKSDGGSKPAKADS